MKIQFLLVYTLIWMAGLNSASAAGSESSGGGNAVVCTDTGGKIVSAEMFDLYEGRALYSLQPQKFSDPADRLATSAVAEIEKGMQLPLSSYLKKLNGNVRFLPSGTGLRPIDDATYIAVPKSCQIVQLARFQDDDQLLFVDADIWGHLDEQNKAALFVHEALYALLRITGESSSDNTRRAVAAVFAGRKFTPITEGVPQNAEKCAAIADNRPAYQFFVYPGANGSAIFQFQVLDAKFVLSKSTLIRTNQPLPLAKLKKPTLAFSKVDSIFDDRPDVFINMFPGVKVGRGDIGIGLRGARVKFKCGYDF